MKQLIYRSQPFGFDKAMLAGILSQARRNNPAKRITGALICRGDMYLQLIEGPVAAINSLYDRIRADDRHANVELLLAERVERRIFPDWAMLDDQNPSLTWSKADAERGALARASHADLRAVFERIAERALKGEV